MSIELFEHNQTAYEAVAAMLAETGKAAVIHPTGIGKSFIGFKLCEDNPDKTVCWLSPSEYIFRTQLENLKKTGADVPKNISFFTYAKLTYMSDEELGAIAPDIIVLDEFHRCGADIWGNRVNSFLNMYKEIPVLGLSATNVRYLNNQRDMAEELFDGNIASEMTLGKAIIRGILKAPLYISTVYSYKNELEKYTRMSKMPKFKAVRSTAEKYLEELRRTIEKADGLDVIFEKYMPDKYGKYVVFCANREHLDEILSYVSEWFSKIDINPKVYKVYSDNPESSSEFADFKADKSENLRLLFCIDMLNEGVHLDDIDGVILFRPTVSPTVYKQQIGCALSYYNSLGESEKIAVDKFEIIGTVNDCVELFDKLNETFTTGWDEMYRCACEYYSEYGNIDVPRRYKTASGLSFGNWLDTQRGVCSGKINGILTEERIHRLDFIGMQCMGFAHAKGYAEHFGDLDVPINYVCEDGYALGRWLLRQRSNADIAEKRRKMLDSIGMVWAKSDRWYEHYETVRKNYEEHGNLDVPSRYKVGGFYPAHWLNDQKRIYRGEMKGRTLSEDKIKKLEALSINWSGRREAKWNENYELLKKYIA